MGDEEEILMDGPGRAPADVKGGVEAGNHHASLVAAHGDPLDEVALHVHALPPDLRPRPPVLLLLLHGPVYHRQKPRPLRGERPVSVAGDAVEAG